MCDDGMQGQRGEKHHIVCKVDVDVVCAVGGCRCCMHCMFLSMLYALYVRYVRYLCACRDNEQTNRPLVLHVSQDPESGYISVCWLQSTRYFHKIFYVYVNLYRYNVFVRYNVHAGKAATVFVGCSRHGNSNLNN